MWRPRRGQPANRGAGAQAGSRLPRSVLEETRPAVVPSLQNCDKAFLLFEATQPVARCPSSPSRLTQPASPAPDLHSRAPVLHVMFSIRHPKILNDFGTRGPHSHCSLGPLIRWPPLLTPPCSSPPQPRYLPTARAWLSTRLRTRGPEAGMVGPRAEASWASCHLVPHGSAQHRPPCPMALKSGLPGSLANPRSSHCEPKTN